MRREMLASQQTCDHLFIELLRVAEARARDRYIF